MKAPLAYLREYVQVLRPLLQQGEVHHQGHYFTTDVSLPVYRKMFVAAGFSEQEITTVSDGFVESLLVFGDESKIKDRLLELLSTGIDELTISLVPVSDPIQERTRLARLIGQL